MASFAAIAGMRVAILAWAGLALAPVSAKEILEDQGSNGPQQAAQAMMDELFPPIEEAAFFKRKDFERAEGALRSLIANGLRISFFARRDSCDRPGPLSCIVLSSDDPDQLSVVLAHAVGSLRLLGLAGSDFGNLPLPQDARNTAQDGHVWVNWSRCVRKPGMPENAIACEQAYHPFPKPSPGVRTVFNVSDGKVIALDFHVYDPRRLRIFLKEKREVTQY